MSVRRRSLSLLAVLAIVVSACASESATTAPSEAPTAAPSEAPAEQTLTMVVDGDVSGGLTNAADNVPTANAAAWLYDALYSYDYSLNPVPKLAAAEAETTDGKVWTVALRNDVKFSNGDPMTAADVVNTFEIAKSPNCRYNPSICLGGILASVEAVDDYTVKFTLESPTVTFLTIYLPGIGIENKKVLDAAYGRYLEATKSVTPAEITDILGKIAAEEAAPTGPAGEDGAPTANYEQFVAGLEAIVTKGGQALPDKEAYTSEGALDAAGYVADLQNRVKAIQAGLEGASVDALAAAYPYLDIQQNPVGIGTGPFVFTSYKSGESLEFTRNDSYFQGAPKLAKIFMPIIKDDLAGAQALVAGQADYKYSLEGPTYEQIKGDPNLKFVEYPDFGFFGLYLNQREGRLFADKNLRQALSWCFDKPETVKAATDNQGVAIYSEIPPASWAFPSSGLNTYGFDPAKGKALIEASGWKLGTDGVYEKDGKKLETVVAVRAERPARSKYMQLLTDQVNENCGMAISFKEVDFGAILNMLDNYPHINAAAPEGGQPFDAYFGGFSTGFDPDPYSLYHSSQCTTAENPGLYNYICYSNPKIDELIDKGLQTFDQAGRAAIYQEYAKIQAEDVPVLYAWADIARLGLRNTVNIEGEELRLDTPTFFYKSHLITNTK